MFLRRRKPEQPEPKEHTLPHGESQDLFGIVFTNATASTLKIKVYPQKVVVISELMKETEKNEDLP